MTNLRRLALSLLATLAILPAVAATVAERSPFTQGLWWNAQRSGHGFEIFNAGTETMVLWYTYDTTGKPTWYSAQGTYGAASWPLRKHRWSNGRLASTEVVGTLGLTVATPESMEVNAVLNGVAAKVAIEPFRLSGVGRDVDRTGVYFDPQASGWGMSLLQQDDVLGGVLYTYDAAGEPTWYAGFDRTTSNSIGFHATRGSCGTCAYTTTTTTPAGRVTLEPQGETVTTLRNSITATFATGASPDGATMVQLGRAASLRPADRSLANFSSDAALKTFLEGAMMVLGPSSSGADFSAAPPAVSVSTTNLQEAGVDEADLVKSDGTRVYTFAALANGTRTGVLRVATVADEGALIRVDGEVPLRPAAASNLLNAGLYLAGNSLVSITGPGLAAQCFDLCWSMSGVWGEGSTNIEIFDASGTSLPGSVWHAKVDGHLVASRRIGDRLYIVARHAPRIAGFAQGTTYEPSRAANRQLLAQTPLSALLPTIAVNGAYPVPLVGAASMYVPPQGTRPVSADMILVYAIDIAQRKLVQSLAILGSADAVYASPTNLYVATSRYQYRSPYGSLLPPLSFSTTEIHQLRLGTEGMSLVGTGTVEGSLADLPSKASFRMGEKGGRLRIVTSDRGMWGSDRRNRLTILEPVAGTGLLKTVAYLPNATRPESIGKPGELVYGTRFVDDRLYAVTFKSIDPLYVIDLANAADPKIAGALEIPGFSEYLHPLPNGLLLGFGKDAKPVSTTGDGNFAWYQGLQLTLFDVSGAGAPREIQRVLIGKRGSDSVLLREHHALSALSRPDGSIALAFPARVHDGALLSPTDSSFYPWSESGLLRYEVRGTGPANASLVALPSLITDRVGASPNPPNDAAQHSGRSLLFQKGTVYIGNGRFWKQNADGIVVGPL